MAINPLLWWKQYISLNNFIMSKYKCKLMKHIYINKLMILSYLLGFLCNIFFSEKDSTLYKVLKTSSNH